MKKYILDCSVYFCDSLGRLVVLHSSDTYSNDLSKLNEMFDKFEGTFYTDDEYIPNKPCIKYSVIIGYNDEKENLHILKEKYYLLDLKDFKQDFWNISNKLKSYTC